MNFKRRILVSLVLTTSLLLLTFTQYYWPQISGFAPPIGITLLLLLLLTVTGKLLSTIITVVKYRKHIRLVIIMPTFIYSLALLLVVVNPKCLNAETYQEEVRYQGCYEGTMNTGIIKFRKSGQFEYTHTGFLGITTFLDGQWQQLGDTILITYTDEKSEFIGSKLLLTEDQFVKIQGDTLVESRGNFYRGYCKGLN